MLEIPEISFAMSVFPANAPLPKWDDIPMKFRRDWHHNEYCEIASKIFYEGGSMASLGLTPKEGVDTKKALKAIQACLGDWSPQHEHKIAGVGYMISEWFDLQPPKKAA